MTDNRGERYARTLSKLIQMKTVSCRDQSDLSAFYAFHRILRETFPHLFAVCEVEEFSGALLLRWRGCKETKAPILLMNHHDVVEAEGAWTHPPFSGTVADGKVWGRGAIDTKGGLFAMLQAADELTAEGFVPAQDVYFESARDEENDSISADLVSQELKRRGVRFSLVLDEGGMIEREPITGADALFAMIGVAEKSYIDLKFTAHSAGGHASTPEKNTPLVRLARFMAEVEDSDIFDVQLTPPVAEMLRRMAPTFSDERRTSFADTVSIAHDRAALDALPPMLRAMTRTTLAFTMAHGSEGRNMLPQEAWVIGNMRASAHQGVDASVAAVTRLAEKYHLSVEILEDGFPATVTDYRGAAFRRVEHAVRAVCPEAIPVPYIMTGATDARFMTRVSDSCLRFLPLRVSGEQHSRMHGVDENVDVAALPTAVDFYKAIIRGE